MVKTFCGNGPCPNDYDRLGTPNECLKKGVGVALYGIAPERIASGRGLPIPRELSSNELDNRPKLFCGDQDATNGVPDGYDRNGTRYECLRKGIGVGLYKIAPDALLKNGKLPTPKDRNEFPEIEANSINWTNKLLFVVIFVIYMIFVIKFYDLMFDWSSKKTTNCQKKNNKTNIECEYYYNSKKRRIILFSIAVMVAYYIAYSRGVSSTWSTSVAGASGALVIYYVL
jgi:hypothetical protein